jgi:hypothetical protein
MTESEQEGTGSLEDPTVPAQDSAVPDPTGAREDPQVDDAIDDATEAAKADIAAALDNPDPEPESAEDEA